MSARPISTHRIVTLALTWSALGIYLGGCADTRREDFYAARSLHLRSKPGPGTITVRAEPTDLLARERRALALGALNGQD